MRALAPEQAEGAGAAPDRPQGGRFGDGRRQLDETGCVWLA
ncbi:hypothetical protein [Shimia sp. R9_1]|nr:hypothetical protein [Shimia sp. R9_1]